MTQNVPALFSIGGWMIGGGAQVPLAEALCNHVSRSHQNGGASAGLTGPAEGLDLVRVGGPSFIVVIPDVTGNPGGIPRGPEMVGGTTGPETAVVGRGGTPPTGVVGAPGTPLLGVTAGPELVGAPG